jgi:hypothetical protein
MATYFSGMRINTSNVSASVSTTSTSFQNVYTATGIGAYITCQFYLIMATGSGEGVEVCINDGSNNRVIFSGSYTGNQLQEKEFRGIILGPGHSLRIRKTSGSTSLTCNLTGVEISNSA